MARPREIEFSDKTKDQAAQRAGGFCENKACGLPFGGRRPEFDHVLPAALGGTNELKNCMALCRACHAAKTADDIKRIRKADRQRRAANGATTSKHPISKRPKPEKPEKHRKESPFAHMPPPRLAREYKP